MNRGQLVERDAELRSVVLVLKWACETDVPVDHGGSGKDGWPRNARMAGPAGRGAGTGPTYPSPLPRGLSPVLARNMMTAE